jgi:FkbH-like protein
MCDPQYLLPAAGENELRYVHYRSSEPLRVVVLGGCITQFAADALRKIAGHNGFTVEAVASWPEDMSLLEATKPDLVVLQLSTTWLLGPLWDQGAVYDDVARAEMVEFIKESCAISIREVRKKTGSGLLLVHGFSRPVVSPLGIHDFRHEYHFERVVFELNEHLRSLMRYDLGAMYLDEERIFGGVGKARLLDHLVAPFSHHGPIDQAAGPPVAYSRDQSFGLRRPYEVAYVLAREYLDHYIAWKGLGLIKCVIVDLDHTLWPLTIGDDGLDIHDTGLRQALAFGVWAGIHQALGLLKQRGVLLATASRNAHDVVMQEWRKMQAQRASGDLEHLLVPDDFVMHEINWGPKSVSIARILTSLGMTATDAMFIDDNPAEREEVRSRHPDLVILGDDLNLVRGHLLTNPRLQADKVSAEAASRTTLVRSQLAREATRHAASSRREFFESLHIRIRAHRLRVGDDLHRCVELLQRTNQFNVALVRRTADDLQVLLRQPDVSLITLEVSDRFGTYGTVGLCILQGDEVTDFAMSCRVIGLSPQVPFLRAALLAHRRSSYRGRIVTGPRNHPCRSLFADAGFRRVSENEWMLADMAELTPVDPTIYDTIVVDERAHAV